jgi:hypothetical protein
MDNVLMVSIISDGKDLFSSMNTSRVMVRIAVVFTSGELYIDCMENSLQPPAEKLRMNRVLPKTK